MFLRRRLRPVDFLRCPGFPIIRCRKVVWATYPFTSGGSAWERPAPLGTHLLYFDGLKGLRIVTTANVAAVVALRPIVIELAARVMTQ